MNLNRKVYIALAFNLIVLVTMISVFTMQPTKNSFLLNEQFQILRRQRQQSENGPEQLSSNETDNSHSDEATRKTPDKATSAMPIFGKGGHDSYSFQLFAVIPIVTCANFTDDKTLPKKDPSEVKRLTEEVGANVRTSFLFNFSPLIDDHVRKMFASNILGEPWFEVHPFQVGCLPDRKGGLFCALRVWLRMDRFQGREKAILNRFQDSFMYVLRLDRNLEYIPGSGDLLGIPAPIQDTAFTGPEDPRIVSINGSMYVNFVMAHSYDDVKIALRRQFLWNVDNSILYDIQVNRFVLNELEKNWTPWVANETLHFVYQFTPVMRVMRCRVNEPPLRSVDCSFIVGQPQYGAVSATHGMLLRGGSPIISYTVPNYYIAVTHSVQGYEGARLYAAQLILINGPAMRIVLISSPIFVEVDKMRRIENLGAPTVKLPFVYARSVIVENANSLIVALGVNDNLCFLVRLEGVAALLSEAIERDKKLTAVSRSFGCNKRETEQQREKWMTKVYGQMNDWLTNKNLVENERRFTNYPPR